MKFKQTRSIRQVIDISKEKRGPRIDPCGTSQVTGRESGLWPFALTNIPLWDKYDFRPIICSTSNFIMFKIS